MWTNFTPCLRHIFFNLQNPIFPLITGHPVYARSRRNFACKIFGTTSEGGNEKRVANHVATFPNARCCYGSADFSNGVTAGGRQIICNERSDRTLPGACKNPARDNRESGWGGDRPFPELAIFIRRGEHGKMRSGRPRIFTRQDVTGSRCTFEFAGASPDLYCDSTSPKRNVLPQEPGYRFLNCSGRRTCLNRAALDIWK